MIYLFEIPVYSISEEKFNEKWMIRRNQYEQHLIMTGSSEAEAKDSFLKCFVIQSTWIYNKIIGYIKILYNIREGNIEFEVYKLDRKKFRYDRNGLICFKKVADVGSAINMHVYVSHKENHEISNLIKNNILYIVEQFFNNKNYYVDIERFSELSSCFDYQKYIKIHKSNNN